MTKEQILEIVRQLYLDKITPGTAVDLLYEQLSAERERAGKLVEALDTIISQNQCCMEDYVISHIIKIAKQTLNEYDPKK